MLLRDEVDAHFKENSSQWAEKFQLEFYFLQGEEQVFILTQGQTCQAGLGIIYTSKAKKKCCASMQ